MKGYKPKMEVYWMLDVMKVDECPQCHKERTVYTNYTAHCFNCNNDFDVEMTYRFKAKKQD